MSELDSPPAPIRLNVGCGRDIQEGWINVDMAPLPGVDIVFNLENCREERLPFEDDTVSEIRLFHVIEHVRDALGLMQELYRVAAPGCVCTIHVPHGASDDAWTDPTHVRPYFPGSFGYFSQPHYWRADYGYRGDWQPKSVRLLVSKQKFSHIPGARLLEMVSWNRNVVDEIKATLIAVKPAREPALEEQEAPKVTVHLV